MKTLGKEIIGNTKGAAEAKTYQTYTIQVHTYKREDTTLSLFGYHVLEKKKHSHHHPK